jgi:hypothetical protein
MKLPLTKIATLLMTTLILISTIQLINAQDHTLAYQLLNKPGGNSIYELNVVVPQYLHDYYTDKSHRLTSSSVFSKFVTPYTLKPVADKLWEIYDNEEDFANGVLMIVHQIKYVETIPQKYPVETMVEQQGDCDLFSFIAASIIKAGGMDVVLLYYEAQSHMNIGVHLSNVPKHCRDSVYYMTYDNRRYYIAECTGGNWRDGWRVGECPNDLRQAPAEVITLENAEQIAPGQVSSSFITMEPSVLLMEVSPSISIQSSTITIHGRLVPAMSNENITVYASINGLPWMIIGTVMTQSDGSFEYIWIAKTSGSHDIRVAWSGNEAYTGAVSSMKNAPVISLFLITLLGFFLVAAVAGIIGVLTNKHTQQQPVAPTRSTC